MSKNVIAWSIGLILTLALIILVTNIIESKSQEAVTVVFPESNSSIEPYLKRIHEYEQDGRYQEAIIVARKAIEFFPEDDRGYSKLKHLYILTGRYTDALEVNEKLIEMSKATEYLSLCGYLKVHAALFEYVGRQGDAIDFLEQYRKECPKTVGRIVTGLKQAMSKGEEYFAPPPRP
ncbi:MAG: hypothetical protein ACFFCW_36100 [Candidatus Hodarchaeota archaeon]